MPKARVVNKGKGNNKGVSGAGATPLLAEVPKARVVDKGKGKNKSVPGAGATGPAPGTPLILDTPTLCTPLIGLPLPPAGVAFRIVGIQRDLHRAFD